MDNGVFACADKIIYICEELKALLSVNGAFDSYRMKLLGKLQRLSLDLGSEDFNEDDEEEEEESHGNTRLPFGLCQREGISIDPNWTAKDAWAALEKKGYSVKDAYSKLRETGEASSIRPSKETHRGIAFSEAVVKALKSKPNEAVFFSGCAQRDEKGKVVKKNADVAREWAENNGGATMGMLLERGMADMPEWDFGDAESIHSWQEASKVYAQQASGDIRVLAKPPLREGNIFESVELPALKENPNVTSVTMINPETGESKVIYRR